MKTNGICSAQSARKHRRAGHTVQRLPSGRYTWSFVPRAKVRPYQRELVESFARASVDVFTDDGGMYTITVNDEFWPRRRNQHSKKFKVLRIVDMPERGTHLVSYSTPRGEMDSTTAREFLSMVGKRVGE